jgi:diadenosine tetraphosphate (Ap4A) HIT family hydrolase
MNDGSAPVPHGLLYEDDLWVVRHMPPPYAVVGWLILQTRRHCPEPAQFTNAEAASFGPMLRRCEAALREVTGAARIYTAALGEKVRHVHVHMVPRCDPPFEGALGWDVFGLERRAAAGEFVVPDADVERVVRDFRETLDVRKPLVTVPGAGCASASKAQRASTARIE